MRQLVALLGLLWTAGNLAVAYLFVTSGLAEKTAHKGLAQQALLVSGGAVVGLFAIFLLWQCLVLATARGGGADQPTSSA